MKLRRNSPGCKFGRLQRLTRPYEYELVLRHADSVFHSGPVRILTKSSRTGHARLGMVVPKRVVHMAVERNAIKRTIREWFRTNAYAFRADDIVVVVRSRPANRQAIYEMIRAALGRWQLKTAK